jgi:hypothetical protein
VQAVVVAEATVAPEAVMEVLVVVDKAAKIMLVVVHMLVLPTKNSQDLLHLIQD